MTSSLTSPVRSTNFVESATLSALVGAKVVFADETKQYTGSFKFRAAYNLASKIKNEHIIASSSGNFAQALSYACSLLAKRCTIVMPANSAQIKIDGVKKYGAQIEFVDTAKENRQEKLMEVAKAYPQAYITNAYDNEYIIEGNRTLGQEIGSYKEKFDYVLSPIGGGGLISGIILGLEDEINDMATLPIAIGAEPAIANDASRSLKMGELIANEIEPQTIADGARTISLGKQNWDILRHKLKQIIEVSEEKIEAAVKLIYDHLQIKAEPTGALSLGAVLESLDQFENKTICCVISGGNIDEQVFQFIMEHKSTSASFAKSQNSI